MNKKALIISLSIFFIMLACIIGGIILIVTNKNFNGFNLNYKISKKVLLEEEYEFDFTNLNIDMDASKIIIKNDDIDKVKIVAYSNEKNIKITKNDDLNIKSKKMKKCKFICINRTIPKVVVYLPSNFENQINITNNLGDIKIEKVNKINIKTDLGNINIKEANNARIENNMGDTKLSNITSYLNIKNNMGDIKIYNLNIDKNSKIKNNMGNIEIGNTNEIYIDAKSELGDIEINNNYRKSDITLTIRNDMGDIEVDN